VGSPSRVRAWSRVGGVSDLLAGSGATAPLLIGARAGAGNMADAAIHVVGTPVRVDLSAGRLPASVYRRSTMYTTLSPCDMCTGAILLYGITRVVIGENRTFMGGEPYLRSRGVEVVNLDSEACVELMRHFIAGHPEIWNEDIGEDPPADGT